jgi:TldD protein
MNARLMKMAVTGNARRESFAHLPMPRMTNTYMLGGDKDPAKSSPRSRTACTPSTSAAARSTSPTASSCSRQRGLHDRGRQDHLSGQGRDADRQRSRRAEPVSMIGNDMRLDSGVGVCGKEGQSVPVGVGQPTLRIDGVTVGGTAEPADRSAKQVQHCNEAAGEPAGGFFFVGRDGKSCGEGAEWTSPDQITAFFAG